MPGGARNRHVQRRRQTKGADGADRLAARVGQRRVLLGLTQKQLAATLRVTQRQMQRYERGLNRIGDLSYHTWLVLKYLLGCPDGKNHDGSWNGWGNRVRALIGRAAE